MFSYKSGYLFGGAARFWWIFILAGLFAFSSPFLFETDVSMLRVVIIGTIAIFFGLGLKLNFVGLQIDNNKNLIRNYTAIFGIKTGEWQAAPEFKKITFTSKNVSSWNTPNGISPTFKSNATIYTIALFSNAENPDCFIQSENAKKADLMAKQLSDIFGIDVERIN